jgi:hypothetical protein
VRTWGAAILRLYIVLAGVLPYSYAYGLHIKTVPSYRFQTQHESVTSPHGVARIKLMMVRIVTMAVAPAEIEVAA